MARNEKQHYDGQMNNGWFVRHVSLYLQEINKIYTLRYLRGANPFLVLDFSTYTQLQNHRYVDTSRCWVTLFWRRRVAWCLVSLRFDSEHLLLIGCWHLLATLYYLEIIKFWVVSIWQVLKLIISILQRSYIVKN